MNKQIKIVLFAAALITVLAPNAFAPSARAANKDMVQLQTMVQNLQDQVQRMQQSVDERLGVMRNLVEQSTDGINKMTASVGNLQATLDRQLQQQQQSTGAKVDQVSAQVQALNDSVDELKARMTQVSKQLTDMANAAQNMPAQQPNPGPSGASSTPFQQGPPPQAAMQAPPAGELYNNALRDYNSGNYDLASQEFGQYMKFYPSTELAGNAQFYLADIEYRQGKYDAAVQDYNKVLEQYPSGNKTPAAELKKGFALLELGQKDAGVRELHTLIARYPRSIEATQAQDRLKRLGAPASAATPARRRPGN